MENIALTMKDIIETDPDFVLSAIKNARFERPNPSRPDNQIKNHDDKKWDALGRFGKDVPNIDNIILALSQGESLTELDVFNIVEYQAELYNIQENLFKPFIASNNPSVAKLLSLLTKFFKFMMQYYRIAEIYRREIDLTNRQRKEIFSEMKRSGAEVTTWLEMRIEDVNNIRDDVRKKKLIGKFQKQDADLAKYTGFLRDDFLDNLEHMIDLRKNDPSILRKYANDHFSSMSAEDIVYVIGVYGEKSPPRDQARFAVSSMKLKLLHYDDNAKLGQSIQNICMGKARTIISKVRAYSKRLIPREYQPLSRDELVKKEK